MTVETQRITLPSLKHMLLNACEELEDQDWVTSTYPKPTQPSPFAERDIEKHNVSLAYKYQWSASTSHGRCRSSPCCFSCHVPQAARHHRSSSTVSLASDTSLSYHASRPLSDVGVSPVRDIRRTRAHTTTGCPSHVWSPSSASSWSSPSHHLGRCALNDRQHFNRRPHSLPLFPSLTYPQPSQQLTHHRYHCVYCTKTFSRPSSLRIHMYSHTGEKPHGCPYPGCGRHFSVQSNMRRHLRVHYYDQQIHNQLVEPTTGFMSPV